MEPIVVHSHIKDFTEIYSFDRRVSILIRLQKTENTSRVTGIPIQFDNNEDDEDGE